MSDLGVGDSEIATLDVAPADNSTVATLVLEQPDGSSTPIPVTGGTLEQIPDTSPTEYRQTWTSDQAVAYDQAGRSVLHWSVTGTGQGTEDLEVFVVASPVAGGPTWWPGRSRVAAYVPHRTLVRSTSSSTESADEYLWGFDSTTTPPGITVDRLIADGVAWVSALVTPLNSKSEALSGVLSALWAAISIERSWPQDDNALQRANDMEKQLNTMLAALKTSNDQANDGTDTGSDIVLPRWAFPAADCRWDSPTYW